MQRIEKSGDNDKNTDRPRSVYIATYGCQMNVRDSEVIKGLLLAKGYKLAENPEDADVVLFNTCSVRQHAEDKVWSEIGRMAKQRWRRGDGGGTKKPIIGLVGCMAQNYGQDAFRKAPEIDFVVGPSDIAKIPAIITKFVHHPSSIIPRNLYESKIWETDGEFRPEEIYHTGFYQDQEHAYVVISEGCDNYCSYCVVPYVRGRLRHRDCGAIVDEVARAVEAGMTQITLLGQNVNSYKFRVPRSNSHVDFVKLLKRVGAVKGLKSLSFVTCHPRDTTQELFEAMRDIPVLKKYLHMPLQSGSDKILKLMNRGYTVKKYTKLVDLYRQLVYNGQLGTDIIIGFPGETDDDHRKTLELVKKICFDSAYIFKYSSRPHTKASLLADDVPRGIKERRHAELLKTQKEISRGLKIKNEK